MRGPFGLQDPDPSAGEVKTSLKNKHNYNWREAREGGRKLCNS